MGIEYEEIGINIRNNRTKEEWTIYQKVHRPNGKPFRWNQEDMEILGFQVVHG